MRKKASEHVNSQIEADFMYSLPFVSSYILSRKTTILHGTPMTLKRCEPKSKSLLKQL